MQCGKCGQLREPGERHNCIQLVTWPGSRIRPNNTRTVRACPYPARCRKGRAGKGGRLSASPGGGSEERGDRASDQSVGLPLPTRRK